MKPSQIRVNEFACHEINTDGAKNYEFPLPNNALTSGDKNTAKKYEKECNFNLTNECSCDSPVRIFESFTGKIARLGYHFAVLENVALESGEAVFFTQDFYWDGEAVNPHYTDLKAILKVGDKVKFNGFSIIEETGSYRQKLTAVWKGKEPSVQQETPEEFIITYGVKIASCSKSMCRAKHRVASRPFNSVQMMANSGISEFQQQKSQGNHVKMDKPEKFLPVGGRFSSEMRDEPNCDYERRHNSDDKRSRNSDDIRSRISDDKRSRISDDKRSRNSEDKRSRNSDDKRSRISDDKRSGNSNDKIKSDSDEKPSSDLDEVLDEEFSSNIPCHLRELRRDIYMLLQQKSFDLPSKPVEYYDDIATEICHLYIKSITSEVMDESSMNELLVQENSSQNQENQDLESNSDMSHKNQQIERTSSSTQTIITGEIEVLTSLCGYLPEWKIDTLHIA